VPTLQRIRRRLPWIVALLMLLIAFTAAGLACACMSDHPLQAIERTVAASVAAAAGAVTATPAATSELWGVIAIVVMASTAFGASDRNGFGRASPEVLQRFRF
jgi:hypothetical protein